LLKEYLSSQKTPENGQKTEYLSAICNKSTERETLAIEAERDYSKIKALEFLSQKIGNIYSGIISGVVSFGVFVEITRFMVEGLIPLSTMKDDYYEYDKDAYCLKGQNTGKSFRLGDTVTIKVKDISIEKRQAIFELQDS
jgi:ribonuclease R